VNLNEYQEKAARTINPQYHNDVALLQKLGIRVVDPNKFNREFSKIIMLMGLAGEVGELMEDFKHHYGHGMEKYPLDDSNVTKEQGDIMWYNAGLAKMRGVTLDEVGEENIQKLMRRYPNGYSSQASVERNDE